MKRLFAVLALLSLLSLSTMALAAESKVSISGASAQKLLDALSDFRDKNVSGVEYLDTSAQSLESGRPAFGKYSGEIFISCFGPHGQEEADCELTLK